MAIQALCKKEDLKEAIRDILSYERYPREVRIVCPVITDPEICDGNTFLGLVQRLSRLENITISLITRKPIVRSQASESERREVLERLNVIETLEALRIKVFDGGKDLHAKIILTESVDDKLALIMSANLTPTGLDRNIEAGICFKNDRNEIYDAVYNYITQLLIALKPKGLRQLVQTTGGTNN